jgi:prepilin-type N-terminal cleavage/methylation domain-containing protein
VRTAKTFTAGFTLVELLIVAVVLAILAAVAVPNYRTRAIRAKEARVCANARLVQQVVEEWAVGNSGAFPGLSDLTPKLFPGGSFPENPFTGAPCRIGRVGFSQGNIGYALGPGTYSIEGYGQTAMVIVVGGREGTAGPPSQS